MAETLIGSSHWLENHSVLVRYLIVRHDNNRLCLLTLSAEDGDTLPVFSSELTARAFLRFNRYGEQWHVRESTAGELISLLMGHIADVDLVTLDPQSARRADEAVAPELVNKRDFINALMQEPILLASR
ncbi:MAG: hypothetical protein M3N10_08090 [Actinomycetota bacterium]|nr:hypothetical protein [Actinomycetota bacterium]HZY65851.1 hypothetical protein [Rubrobacteraceae bacterium]